MSSMKLRSNQDGEINMLLVPLVLVTLLFLAAAGFGLWAYSSRTDYKNNSDQKVAAAVETARKQEGIAKDKAFAEREKNPLTTYQGPSAFGSVRVNYPKTWSTYVHSTAGTPLDTYFAPRAVPTVEDVNSVYSLRIQVLAQPYTEIMQALEDQIKTQTITATPFAFPKVPDVIGTRLNGQINSEKKTTGSMIIMPLRDKTLEVYTESPEFLNDFNNTIIPQLVFSP